ncbi:MAG: DUF3048 domain-containing protein [Actinomycetes bacterium]|jgi:hypothetical protein|nr:DUF3048 domain-containing protein [Actinomycetes bacterium]
MMNMMNKISRNRQTKLLTVALLTVALALGFTLSACKKKKPVVVKPPAGAVSQEATEPAAPQYFWPLTGLPSDDPTNTARRPLSVKIENSPQAQPQTGLNSADIIYESMIEGAESRFNALYQSTIPKEVGPVRSARHTDLWIVPQYQGMLFYSGCNSEVRSKLKAAKLDIFPDANPAAPLYSRSTDRKTPHNLYLDTKAAYKLLKKHTDIMSATPATLNFDTAETAFTPDGALEGFEATRAASVNVHYYQHAIWTWNEERGVYLRKTGDKPHIDRASGEQMWIDNVVVMFADYSQAQKKDPAGSPTYDTNMGGEGKAYLLRDGWLYKCRWKADRNAPPRLFDANGKELSLKPGRTCFEVPPKKMLKTKIKYAK